MFPRLTLLLPALALGAFAQSLQITWIGQSCFIVRGETGSPVVVTDPPAPSVGYKLPAIQADVVTVSHGHGDHSYMAGVGGRFTLVDGRDLKERREVTAAGLPFVLLPGFHDNQGGAARGPNAIVVWRQGGLRLAHFGDYGQDALTPAQLDGLRGVDVLFIPAGGFFTIDAARAAELVKQLKPRVAILMHYRTALGGPARLADLAAVSASFGEVKRKPSQVSVSKATLPAATEVWALEPAAQ